MWRAWEPVSTRGRFVQVGLFAFVLFLWLAVVFSLGILFGITGRAALLMFLVVGGIFGILFLPLFRRVYLNQDVPGEAEPE